MNKPKFWEIPNTIFHNEKMKRKSYNEGLSAGLKYTDYILDHVRREVVSELGAVPAAYAVAKIIKGCK